MHESYSEHRERIRSQIQHGQLWVRHNFFFGAEVAGARAAKRELTEAGYQYAWRQASFARTGAVRLPCAPTCENPLS